jgi:hypothetical protein
LLALTLGICLGLGQLRAGNVGVGGEVVTRSSET